MPAITGADLAEMRSAPSKIDYFLAIHPQTVVFQASLNNGDAGFGNYVLSYDNVTVGAWGDIEVGMTLRVYDDDGVTLKGRARIRGATAAQLEVSQNWDIDWEDDDILQVIYEYAPWSWPTNMADVDGTIVYYKDWDIVFPGSTILAFPPKANAVGIAGFLDAAGNMDVPFQGSRSQAQAPSAVISSYWWETPDGVWWAGVASSPDPTIRYSQTGFRYVKLTVTDSNQQTGFIHVPVWTFGGGYQPVKNFSIDNRMYEVRDGELRVTLYETDLTEDDIFPGVRVCLFTRQYVGQDDIEVTADWGAHWTSRHQVRFDGWVLKDTVTWDAEAGTVSFAVGTIGKIADDMPGYGTFLKTVDDTPANWHEVNNLTVRMATYFPLRWHSNLHQIISFELWDYLDADNTTLVFGREFPVQGPLKQVEAALLHRRGVFAYAGVSRWSSIHIRWDPQMLDDTDRDARATLMHHFVSDCYTEMNFDRSTRPKATHIWGGGIYWNGANATPYRSRAPGSIGREGGKRSRAENLIISGQADLNALLSRLIAAESSEWDEVPLETMFDVYEPALQEYVTVDIDPALNPRGYDFDSSTRWLVRRSSIEDFSKSTPVVRIDNELLTEPLSAITVQIPVPPPMPKPPKPKPPIDLPGPEPLDLGWVVVAATEGAGMIYTEDISPTFPEWLYAGTNLITADVVDFCFDDQNPARMACIVKNANYGSSELGDVYVIDDYQGGGVWTKVFDGAAQWAVLDATCANTLNDAELVRCYSFNGRLVVVVSYDDGIYVNYMRCYVSTDWSAFTMGAYLDSGLRGVLGWDWIWEFDQYDQEIVMTSGGTLVYWGRNQTGTFERCVRMYSVNYGLTWATGANDYCAGGWHGVDIGYAVSGALILADGSVMVLPHRDTNGSEEYQISEFAGADYPASIDQELDKAVIQTVDDVMNPQQCFLGSGLLYFWAEAHADIDPDANLTYGWTKIYRTIGHPATWNSVSIEIFGRSLDSFVGDRANVIPENRIVIGNGIAYAAAIGDRSIYLLEEAGTQLSNKSGQGGTGVYGLGATLVARVRFDQTQ